MAEDDDLHFHDEDTKLGNLKLEDANDPEAKVRQEKVKKLLRVDSMEFFAPPADRDDPTAPITGITAWEFPEWFIAQYELREPGSAVRSRPLVHRADLVRGQYQIDRKKHKVVPVRFVQACTRGHVSDIDWHVFVHGKEDKCRRNLWLDERGTSGELSTG